MSLDVRDATHADINTLIRLNEVVQSLHAALYPDAFKRLADPPAARAFFAERMADPKSSITIVETDRGAPRRLCLV
jgi:hypothetical protein